MKTSDLGLQLIIHYEGLKLHPYLDVVGVCTVGYGHALALPNGKWMTNISDVPKYYPQFVNLNMDGAKVLLASDVVRFENSVNSLQLSLNQGQFDALVDFAFNVGFGALQGSTLLKRIKGTVITPTIEQCFKMWNKITVNGKKITSSWQTARRKSEFVLYSTGQLKFFA